MSDERNPDDKGDSLTSLSAVDTCRAAYDEAEKCAGVLLKTLMKNMEEMQRQQINLRAAYDQLQQEHVALRSEHDTALSNMSKFKAWWVAQKERKRKSGGSVANTPAPASDKVTALRGEGKAPITPDTKVSVPFDWSMSAVKSEFGSSDTDFEFLHEAGIFSSSRKDVNKSHQLSTPIKKSLVHASGSEEGLNDHTEQAASKRPVDVGEAKSAHSPRELEARSKATDAAKNLPRKSTTSGEARVSTDMSGVKKATPRSSSEGSSSVSSMPTVKTTDPPRQARKTINAQWQVDPEGNGGVAYLHKEVVRGKEKRRKLEGHECTDCGEYYETVGPLAKRPYEDEKSALARRCPKGHAQLVSRHRGYAAPDPTPPGYMDIAFPTTQKVQEYNKAGKELLRKKQERMVHDSRFQQRAAAG